MSKTHAFLKRSVPLNVAKAAINGFIILNLLAKWYSQIPCPLSRSFKEHHVCSCRRSCLSKLTTFTPLS